MNKTIRLIFIVATLFISCSPSMTPMQLNKTLPNLTKSKFIAQIEAEDLVKSNNCKYLVQDRNYVAVIGLTAKDDLKDGARGIDQWVKIDNGNAYALKNYEWVAADYYGSSQLRLVFDTMLCE